MVNLIHDDLGEGPPLLLIHAYPLDGRLWTDQRHVLSRVARVLIPDCRGFGRSASFGQAASLDDHAADMARLLAEKQIDRAVLCGVSMGGYIALSFLEQFPARVAGLILCNTRSQADTPEGRATRLKTAEQVMTEGVGTMVSGLPEKMLSEVTRRDCPEVGERLLEQMQQQSPDALAAAQRAMAARPDRTSLLAELRIPALVIAGENDPLIPRADVEAMVAAMPAGTRLVTIPDTAHLANLERPAAFNEEVIRFMTAG